MEITSSSLSANLLSSHDGFKVTETKLSSLDTKPEKSSADVKNGEYTKTLSVKKDIEVRAQGSSGSGVSSAFQLVLERLREQIAEVKEKIAKVEAQLSSALVSAKGEASSVVDALRGQLNGLQGQLSSLMSAYTDVLKEKNQSTKGSIINTKQ
ncbi:MAG: hypothetical protein ACKVJE_17915 [Pseudomonadales bacterium]